MSRQTDEREVDLSLEEDTGFSLGAISIRDSRRMLSPDQKVEAEVEAGKIAAFAALKGLNFAVKDVSPPNERDVYVTTFVLGERWGRDSKGGAYELTVDISANGTHKTSDGRVKRTAALSIGPHKPPSFFIEDARSGGGSVSYEYEASAGELRSVLGSLQRGTFDNLRGSAGNPEVPSWRSLAPQR